MSTIAMLPKEMDGGHRKLCQVKDCCHKMLSHPRVYEGRIYELCDKHLDEFYDLVALDPFERFR